MNKAATSTKTSTRTPAKTGDDSQFGLWYALLLASGSAAVIAAYNRKKKTKAE
ncbi:MAG: sortase B protein-sorting domain-containing protein [Blautia sp.]